MKFQKKRKHRDSLTELTSRHRYQNEGLFFVPISSLDSGNGIDQTKEKRHFFIICPIYCSLSYRYIGNQVSYYPY
jgi:hypothetical protein